MSIREQILNGNYNKNNNIREQILNGTYNGTTVESNNSSSSLSTETSEDLLKKWNEEFKESEKEKGWLYNAFIGENIFAKNKHQENSATYQKYLEALQQENKTKNENISDIIEKSIVNPETIPKTALTTANYIGQGTLKGAEGIADAIIDVGTSNVNPYYWFNQDKLKAHNSIAREIIETDATNQLITKLSGDENFNQNVLDKGSLVKSTNIGGQVAQGIGQMLPAIALGNPTAATGTIGVSSYGSGVEEAYKDGANTTQARLYGLGNMATEMATEWLTGGVPGVKSKLFSGLDNIVAKGLGKETLEEVSQSLTKELLQAGYKMVGEGTEEALTEILKPLLKNTIYTDGEKINWEEVINSFIVGAITGGVLEAPTNISNVKYAYKNTVNNVRNLGQNSNNNVLAPLAVNNVNTGIKNSLNIDTNNAYQYEVSDNQKINAFNESIKTSGLINSETTKSFADICTKVIQDRDVNILVDSTLENNVNGLYDANTNTIKINPNSERAAEFILTHELTHSIATDEMIRLANDYANKNLDFKTSVESLLNQYNKTEIDEEVLADISGQLFGNQEFINNLSMQEPSLFKKIYNKIIEWANKLTGNTHEALFMRDLKNKWETAYRTNTNQSEGNIKYSVINNSDSKVDNIRNLEYYNNQGEVNYGEKGIDRGKVDNEEIFKQEMGKNVSKREQWERFENSARKQSTTKPTIEQQELTKYVKTNFNKQLVFFDGKLDYYGGASLADSNIIYVSSELPEYGQKFVVHHEVMESLISHNADFNDYANDAIYEIINDDGFKKTRQNFLEDEIDLESVSDYAIAKDILCDAFASSYTDVKVPYEIELSQNTLENIRYTIELANKELHTSDKVEKINDKIYNKIGDEASEIFEENDYNDIEKTDESTIQSYRENKNGLEELDNSSFSYDNKGRALTKEQQEFFKYSKAVDENGNIKVLYHGTPNEFNKFSYEFLGTNGTLLGKGFYLTDDINVAKAYANKGQNGKVMELYVDIKKPLKWGETTISKQQFQNFVEAVNQATEGRLFADYSGEFSEKGSKQYNSTLNDILMDYEYGGDDIDLVSGILNSTGMRWDKGYKILKDTTGYDGIIVTTDVYDSGEGNVYIPFQSNQIKNVDNTNPTFNEDIRYSQNSNNWQKHLEENYKSTGTKTYFKDMMPYATKESIPAETTQTEKANKVLNPNEISKLKPSDANTTPIAPKVKVDTGTGKSKFFDNILDKTDMLTWDSKKTILSDDDVKYYKEVTNEESLEKAFDRLNKGGRSETENWLRKDSENATSVDIAEGWILLKQYQDNIEKTTDISLKDELNRSMVQVAKKMRDMGTKAGQTVQAFNIMNRLTPEGMVYYAQSELSEAYDNMVKNKTKDWIDNHKADFELSPSETQFIMDTMQKVSQMEDGYDKKVELAKIQKLMTDKLPPERGAGIKAWMRISMLFNPKTQVRNVAGNAVIAPVNSVSDLVASGIDKLISSKTGIRTTGKTDLKSYSKGFKKGLSQSYNDFRLGINTRNIDGNRFEIGKGKSFNNKTKIGKSLNAVDNVLSFMLDAGDRGFYEASFNNSINNQMILNNTTEVTQDMIDIATSEALSRTWQDNNGYTQFVLNIRKGLNKINFRGYGLGDTLIPFAKTPANLTKAIVDYSPVGMINVITSGINLKRSLSNGQFTPQMQHKFVQNLGKATAGTMLYVLGYALAKAGITSGESDEDKDVANFMKNTLGVSSYSIKIGNKSFTYDWAQPIAAPLSIMANFNEKQKDNPDASTLENLVNSLDVAGNILLEQSFMESINTVFSNNDGPATGIQEAIMELPSRAVPTLMKQIVDLTDSTQRQSFVYDNPLETMANKVKAKIPGLSQALAPTVDTMGREIQKYGGKNNIFNVFFNPANVNTENISKSAEEIYRLYKATGDTTVMPRVSPYYINSKGEKVILTNQQKSEFQKISGNIIEDSVKELLKDSQYKNLSNEDKASVVNEIVNYSYNKARHEVLGMEMSNTYNKVNEYTNKGGQVYDYYLNKEEINYSLNNPEKYNVISSLNFKYDDYSSYQTEINDIKNQYSTTTERKQAVFNYINNLQYNKYQKIILFKLLGGYGIKDYQNEIFNYINSLKLSKNEKQTLWNYLYS